MQTVSVTGLHKSLCAQSLVLWFDCHLSASPSLSIRSCFVLCATCMMPALVVSHYGWTFVGALRKLNCTCPQAGLPSKPVYVCPAELEWDVFRGQDGRLACAKEVSSGRQKHKSATPTAAYVADARRPRPWRRPTACRRKRSNCRLQDACHRRYAHGCANSQTSNIVPNPADRRRTQVSRFNVALVSIELDCSCHIPSDYRLHGGKCPWRHERICCICLTNNKYAMGHTVPRRSTQDHGCVNVNNVQSGTWQTVRRSCGRAHGSGVHSFARFVVPAAQHDTAGFDHFVFCQTKLSH